MQRLCFGLVTSVALAAALDALEVQPVTCAEFLISALRPEVVVLISAVALAAIWFSPKKLKAKQNAGAHGDSSQYADDVFTSEDFLSMGMPAEPHLEGGFLPPTELVYSNASDSFPFDNENCSGSFVPLHRPTYDSSLDKSGKFPYGDHFRGKKRIWELRYQLKFKKRPTESKLFFGVECETYVPLNAATKRVMDFTVSSFRQLCGESLYHSVGDDPNEVQGETERPTCMLPLWALDQFIVTPEGEEPPSLTEPGLEELGEKRVGRVREYQHLMDELDLRPGPTYTFCFWGISRWFDVIAWEAQNIPLVTPLDINQYCGRPPLYLVFYTLNDGYAGEKRHLQSRKNYYFRCGFWSSEQRPRQSVVLEFLGSSLARLRRRPGAPSRQQAADGKGWKGLSSLFRCCVEQHQ